MLEQMLLSEQFQHLLSRERQAMEMYSDLAGKLSDSTARQQVQQLLRDKQRHVELTQRLLQIVE